MRLKLIAVFVKGRNQPYLSPHTREVICTFVKLSKAVLFSFLQEKRFEAVGQPIFFTLLQPKKKSVV